MFVDKMLGQNKKTIWIALSIVLALTIFQVTGLTGQWHPLNQISKSSTDMTPVDANDNGIIDEADSVFGNCILIYGPGGTQNPASCTIPSCTTDLKIPDLCLNRNCQIIVYDDGSQTGTTGITMVVDYLQLWKSTPTGLWRTNIWQPGDINGWDSSSGKNGDNIDKIIANILIGAGNVILYDDYASANQQLNTLWTLTDTMPGANGVVGNTGIRLYACG